MSRVPTKVLIVDDEQAIRRFLRATLSAHGYAITEAGTARQALEQCARAHPDLVILDLGLPDMEGIEVTRRIREWSQVPVIILSVREREADKVAALDAGADDYLTKPFGVGELMARLRVALRRAAQPGAETVFQSGDLLFDAARRLVTMEGQELQLTPTEYELLRVLVQHAGRVLTHRQLLQEVWGPAYASETHLLRVNISNLRRKLEPDPSRPRYILTEPGVGYRLHVTL
jgi:two-component system, OmpR family, KDP operon response regulator KdpE